jgi:hypothetical protein
MYRPNNKECVINSAKVNDVSELTYMKFYKYYEPDCAKECPEGRSSSVYLSPLARFTSNAMAMHGMGHVLLLFIPFAKQL